MDLYLRVRLACHVGGLSQREAASRFGITREMATVGNHVQLTNVTLGKYAARNIADVLLADGQSLGPS